MLNCIEEVDLAALHHTFLPILREDLENFRQSFMHHKVRTEKNRSPLQIWQDAVDDGYPIDIVDEVKFTFRLISRHTHNVCITTVQMFILYWV